MIQVRNAEPSDYELLATLGRRAFFEAFGAFNDPDDMQAYLDLAFDKERIREQLEDRANTFFIATINDQPAGYAKLKRGTTVPELGVERVIQLERIYALQDFLGKRIGKALMEECIKVAKGEGFEKMWLSVWQPNQRAITFYEKWGFEKIGIKQFIIGKEVNDDFVMALKLTNTG